MEINKNMVIIQVFQEINKHLARIMGYFDGYSMFPCDFSLRERLVGQEI